MSKVSKYYSFSFLWDNGRGFCWIISYNDRIIGIRWVDRNSVLRQRMLDGSLDLKQLDNIIDDFFKGDKNKVIDFFIGASDENLDLLLTMYKLKNI